MLFLRTNLIVLLMFTYAFAGSQTSTLLTHYEKGNYHVTPSYSETLEFCQLLASSSEIITYNSIGKSALGLEIPLLVADRDGFSNPGDIRAANRGILLILACNHSGEPDGKDAGLVLFRDIALRNRESLKLLENFSIVFIPIFNVDGHERFGPHTRINQNGPEEAGWRTTAQNLNLNRDFLKAEAPEMQQFLNFYHHWYPDFSIDCHTTNGADYQYVVTYAIETGPQTDQRIAKWSANEYLPYIEQKMTEDNYPIFPYISFKRWHDPREAVLHRPSPAIISNGYFAATNRPGLLIETHMLKPYRVRVESTLAMIKHTLIFLNQEHEKLQMLINNADQSMLSGEFKKTPFPLATGLSQDSVMIEFLGVRFEADSSELSGGIWFRYFPDEPEIWERPFFSTPEITKSQFLPSSYIIPPQWSHIAQRLKLHGVTMQKTNQEQTFRVETILFENVSFESKPYEGCMRPKYNIKSRTEDKTFPAGSWIVPLNQNAGRVIALLLEPESIGSFAAWGYFNTIFEQKEYSEMYVMEKIARQMLEDDPALLHVFENEKAAHPDFFENQWNVLFWFYKQTPWFDQQMNVYPVGRVLE
jgi:hypothetical protein